MPSEVRIEQRIVTADQVELHLDPVAVPEPLEQGPQHGPLESPRLQKRSHELRVARRELRQRLSPSGESLRIFKRALEDEPRHRIDVDRGHVAPQTHPFEGNRASASERIQHSRCPPAEGLANLVPKPLQILVALPAPVKDPARSLLLHLLLQPAVHPVPLHPLHHAPGQTFQNSLSAFCITGISKQRRDQRRPARRQRPSRRPDVQRRYMPVSHVLLVDRIHRDLLERKRCFDQAFVKHMMPILSPSSTLRRTRTYR